MAKVSLSLSTLMQLTHAIAGYPADGVAQGLLLGRINADQTVDLRGALPTPATGDVARRAHHYLATRPHLSLVGSYALNAAPPQQALRVHMRVHSTLFAPPARNATAPTDAPAETTDVLAEICEAAVVREDPQQILSHLTIYLSGSALPLNASEVQLHQDQPALLVLQSLFALRTTKDISACPLGRPPKTNLLNSQVLQQLAALHKRGRLRTLVGQDLSAEELEEAETARKMAAVMGSLRELLAHFGGSP